MPKSSSVLVNVLSLHDYTLSMFAVLRVRETQTGSQEEIQVGLCVFCPVPKSPSNAVVVSLLSNSKDAIRIQGTVYGRIRDTLHCQVRP